MKWLRSAVRWYLPLSALCCIGYAAKEKDCALDSTGVYVSISSDADFIEGIGYLRWVQIHWFGITDFRPSDVIGLWRYDPTVYPESIVEKHLIYGFKGSVKTQEKWNGSLIPSLDDTLKNGCLPYWAGYIRDGNILYSNCLMVRPHWMSDMQAEISQMKMSEIVIPGSHDAGASFHFSSTFGPYVDCWIFTQDETFWQQLVFGIRYVDVRVSYYPNTREKLFISHSIFRIAPLKIYIEDIVNFMSRTNEIVIFDIHSLVYGFEGHPEREAELISVLESEFSQWIVPRSLWPNPTLAELWENNTRLIVTFPKKTDSYFLWDKVDHLWGNINNLTYLEQYMDTKIPEKTGRGYLWSAMTEFTPHCLDILKYNRWGGLRGAASITNAPVTIWLRNKWWKMVNIVAMDFFLSSDVVSVAVEANEKKSICLKENKLLNNSFNLADYNEKENFNLQPVVEIFGGDAPIEKICRILKEIGIFDDI